MITFDPKPIVEKLIAEKKIRFVSEILTAPQTLYMRTYRARMIRAGMTTAGKPRQRPHNPLPQDPDARRVERLYRQRVCMRNKRRTQPNDE